MAPRRPRIPIDEAAVRAFCERWRAKAFALFGAVMRPDFSYQSDIDAMVRFQPESGRVLWDLVDMQDELGALFRAHGPHRDAGNHGQPVSTPQHQARSPRHLCGLKRAMPPAFGTCGER